jgi:hypothetical protein
MASRARYGAERASRPLARSIKKEISVELTRENLAAYLKECRKKSGLSIDEAIHKALGEENIPMERRGHVYDLLKIQIECVEGRGMEPRLSPKGMYCYFFKYAEIIGADAEKLMEVSRAQEEHFWKGCDWRPK